MEYERGEWDIAPNPDGQYVLLADVEAAIAAARADMLAKCITALEVEMEGETQDRVDGLWDAIVALRALQEKP
jgi:hypothetical protein